jgi:hypothetical protein
MVKRFVNYPEELRKKNKKYLATVLRIAFG